LLLLKKIFPEIPSTYSDNKYLFSLKRIIYFLLTITQLIALLYIVKKLNIEKNSGISEINLLIILSFSVTTFVPLRFRPFVFFITAISIIYFAFGFFSGTILTGGALTLIAICHLPIKLIFRSLIILCVFTGMAILRVDFVYMPRFALVVPFLASMFMFRVILYLFELKYNSTRTTIWQSFSYFFIFPNICFLFFPIIDYKTFLKTYYNIPDRDLWQKGVRWMLRGVIHIIGYRIIYYYICIPSDKIIDLPSLLQFIVANYALILRLSGLFHFIAGLLCLFGFNLPPTFDNYFLATSFTDLWKRINTYWRDFILKIFLYPFIFKVKKIIPKYAILLATFLAFGITWFFHNYQLFWIRGYFQLAYTDIIFWSVFGICVTLNVLVDEKQMSTKKTNENKYLNYVYTMLKIVSMFLFMSIMWSLWTSVSLSEWMFLMSKGTKVTLIQMGYITSIFIGVLLLGVVIQTILIKQNIKKIINIKPYHTIFLTIPCLSLLVFYSFKMDIKIFPIKVQSIINVLSSDKFNETDKRNVDVGYYKKVMDGEDDASTYLWEINLKHFKKHTNLDNIFLRRNGIISRVLKPNTKVQMSDYSIETNSFGLRDKEYSLKPPPNTYRIALLGGSYVMGTGISNYQVFENLTEKELNEHNIDTTCKKFEIINFGMNRYHLIQHVELCNTKVFNFNPNAVVYVAHSDEEKWFLMVFSSLIQNGTNLKYPFVENIRKVSGVKQSMSESEIKERLKPFAFSLIMWSYMQIKNTCYKHHVKAIWVYLPTTDDVINPEEYKKLQHFASLCGFITLDLRGVYDNLKVEDIQVSKTNTHPNAKGHQLIAKKFYEELIKNKKQIFDINK